MIVTSVMHHAGRVESPWHLQDISKKGYELNHSKSSQTLQTKPKNVSSYHMLQNFTGGLYLFLTKNIIYFFLKNGQMPRGGDRKFEKNLEWPKD